MNLSFNKHLDDEFVRIVLDKDYLVIAISSTSITFPGLWKNEGIKIIGVDSIW